MELRLCELFEIIHVLDLGYMEKGHVFIGLVVELTNPSERYERQITTSSPNRDENTKRC